MKDIKIGQINSKFINRDYDKNRQEYKKSTYRFI